MNVAVILAVSFVPKTAAQDFDIEKELGDFEFEEPLMKEKVGLKTDEDVAARFYFFNFCAFSLLTEKREPCHTKGTVLKNKKE